MIGELDQREYLKIGGAVGNTVSFEISSDTNDIPDEMRKRIDECIDYAMLALWLSLKDELYFPYGFDDAEELREWMDRNMAGQTMVVSFNGVEIVHDTKGH